MVQAMKQNESEHFSEKEAQRRFEQALRGSREVGPTPMKDVPPKRAKKQRAQKVKKRETT